MRPQLGPLTLLTPPQTPRRARNQACPPPVPSAIPERVRHWDAGTGHRHNPGEAQGPRPRPAHMAPCRPGWELQSAPPRGSPRLLVAELLSDHLAQLQAQAVGDLLGQVLVRAATEDLDVGHGAGLTLPLPHAGAGAGSGSRLQPPPARRSGECNCTLSQRVPTPPF